MRSCDCRPCPWGARRRSWLRCSKTQHCGSLFSTSANLRRQCKVPQRQRQLFSFYCKSAHEGRASVSGGSHPHSHRLVFWAMPLACFHIYFTIHIIRHKSQWKCSISLLLFFLIRTQAQQWGNSVCCGLSDRVCVCLCACACFQSGAERAGGRGFAFWASALNTADQWITRAKAAEKVPPVSDRSVDPPSPSFLTSGSDKTGRVSAAARSDASVWESAAAASLTPPRWDISARKCPNLMT